MVASQPLHGYALPYPAYVFFTEILSGRVPASILSRMSCAIGSVITPPALRVSARLWAKPFTGDSALGASTLKTAVTARGHYHRSQQARSAMYDARTPVVARLAHLCLGTVGLPIRPSRVSPPHGAVSWLLRWTCGSVRAPHDRATQPS